MTASSAAGAGLVPLQTSGFVGQSISVQCSPNEQQAKRVSRMRKAVWAAGQWLSRTKASRCWFVTLTYRPGVEYQPRHISDYMRQVRLWLARLGVQPRYVWVGELQKRGALHYHVAVWLPRALALPKADKAGWWPHGMTQRALAIAPIGYLMKYVSKGDQPFASFPKGVRIYGIGGLCTDGREHRQWLNLPEWAKRLHGVGELSRRACGLVVRTTGEVLDSPWVREFVSGQLFLRLTREMAPRFHDHAYSTWPRVTA